MRTISTNYPESIPLLTIRKPKSYVFGSAKTTDGPSHLTSSKGKKSTFHSTKIDHDYWKARQLLDGNASSLHTSIPSSMRHSIDKEALTAVHAPCETRQTISTKYEYKTSFRKRSFKRKLSVTFSSRTHLEPTKTRKMMRKRKTMSDRSSSLSCDPARWYTRSELKTIQHSCISDLFIHQFQCNTSKGSQAMEMPEDPILERFSERNRKRRKLARWKMYETTKVVKEFEAVTGKRTSPEFLSKLLCLHSKPMKMDAIESALKMSMVREVPDPVPLLYMPVNCSPIKTARSSVSSRSTSTKPFSSEISSTLTYARMILNRSQIVQKQQGLPCRRQR